MYRAGHIAFILISLVLIAGGLIVVRRTRPTIDQLIRVCLPLAFICEVIKLFSVIEIVPIVDAVVVDGQLAFQETGAYSPYLMPEHFPLELCSLQMVFMFLALIIKSPEWRHRIHSIIYGTSLAGGLLALFLSSIAPEFETAAAFLTSVRAWEFFVYHSLIIVVGLSIALDRECDLRFSDIRWLLSAVVALDFTSLYLNSALSVPVFQGGELKGLSYAVNFLSSYDDPLGITLSDKPRYLTYLAVRYAIGGVVVLIMYLPFLKRGPVGTSRKGVA